MEKRKLGVSYPCDKQATHTISNGDAMPLTPENLTLTAYQILQFKTSVLQLL